MIEARWVVLHPEHDDSAGFSQECQRVDRLRQQVGVAGLVVAPLAKERIDRLTLEDHDRFEQRCVGGDAAPALHPGHRSVLVRPHRLPLVAERGEPRAERGFVVHLHPDRHRIDRGADHRLDALDRRAPAPPRRAEEDLLLAGVPTEEDRPRSLNHGVERHSMAGRRIPEAPILDGVQSHPGLTAAKPVGRFGRGRVGDHQRRWVNALQPVPPVVRGRRPVLAGHPFRVPPKIRRCGQPVQGAGALPVRRQEVGHHHRGGPPVQDGMVPGEHHPRQCRAETEDRDPRQWRLGERETDHPILVEKRLEPDGLRLGRPVTPVGEAEWRRRVREHFVDRRFHALPPEPGSEQRMPAHRGEPGLLKPFRVDRAKIRDRLNHVHPGAGVEQGVRKHALLERGHGEARLHRVRFAERRAPRRNPGGERHLVRRLRARAGSSWFPANRIVFILNLECTSGLLGVLATAGQDPDRGGAIGRSPNEAILIADIDFSTRIMPAWAASKEPWRLRLYYWICCSFTTCCREETTGPR